MSKLDKARERVIADLLARVKALEERSPYDDPLYEALHKISVRLRALEDRLKQPLLK